MEPVFCTGKKGGAIFLHWKKDDAIVQHWKKDGPLFFTGKSMALLFCTKKKMSYLFFPIFGLQKMSWLLVCHVHRVNCNSTFTYVVFRYSKHSPQYNPRASIISY